jgi:hypothetical protein
MDKTGVVFVILLAALAALVISVLLIETEPAGIQSDDGSLIPPAAVDRIP